MSRPVRVLVVGCGHMGTSHAKAYHAMEGFEIVGVVSRGEKSRQALLAALGHDYPQFSNYEQALAATRPDAVSINTYPDTHADYARKAFAAGCHVFLEKPLANTVAEAREVVDLANETGRKLVIGYVLRVHPTWTKFIETAKTLGKPLVMRMNLNQQSSAEQWKTHKQLMNSLVTGMYNYGQLQVTFADGSVGWYEAGWGPMMSEVAYFVKDVIGPKGCVSIVGTKEGDAASDDVNAHSKAALLKLHHAETKPDGTFARRDEFIDCHDEPDHDGLCRREQEVFLDSILHDRDLTAHMEDAVSSLRIVLAADESFKTGRTVDL